MRRGWTPHLRPTQSRRPLCCAKAWNCSSAAKRTCARASPRRRGRESLQEHERSERFLMLHAAAPLISGARSEQASAAGAESWQNAAAPPTTLMREGVESLERSEGAVRVSVAAEAGAVLVADLAMALADARRRGDVAEEAAAEQLRESERKLRTVEAESDATERELLLARAGAAWAAEESLRCSTELSCCLLELSLLAGRESLQEHEWADRLQVLRASLTQVQNAAPRAGGQPAASPTASSAAAVDAPSLAGARMRTLSPPAVGWSAHPRFADAVAQQLATSGNAPAHAAEEASPSDAGDGARAQFRMVPQSGLAEGGEEWLAERLRESECRLQAVEAAAEAAEREKDALREELLLARAETAQAVAARADAEEILAELSRCRHARAEAEEAEADAEAARAEADKEAAEREKDALREELLLARAETAQAEAARAEAEEAEEELLAELSRCRHARAEAEDASWPLDAARPAAADALSQTESPAAAEAATPAAERTAAEPGAVQCRSVRTQTDSPAALSAAADVRFTPAARADLTVHSVSAGTEAASEGASIAAQTEPAVAVGCSSDARLVSPTEADATCTHAPLVRVSRQADGDAQDEVADCAERPAHADVAAQTASAREGVRLTATVLATAAPAVRSPLAAASPRGPELAAVVHGTCSPLAAADGPADAELALTENGALGKLREAPEQQQDRAAESGGGTSRIRAMGAVCEPSDDRVVPSADSAAPHLGASGVESQTDATPLIRDPSSRRLCTVRAHPLPARRALRFPRRRI
eukprot:TRINITY_DN13296_c0_g1_i13.p1 TRINITY_DN13296_c0_g1~~TRINITY_DN13296_c0_g1_i13.p1  ORF type:complete len:772 (+),score=249.21 TRINITY_DN13296_c0_g1_i13:910-3225(+)